MSDCRCFEYSMGFEEYNIVRYEQAKGKGVLTDR
jgi:hypothetical protein